MSKKKRFCQVFRTFTKRKNGLFSKIQFVNFAVFGGFCGKSCVLNVQKKRFCQVFRTFTKQKNGLCQAYCPVFRRTTVFTQFLPPLAPPGRSGKIGGNTMFCEFPFLQVADFLLVTIFVLEVFLCNCKTARQFLRFFMSFHKEIWV